VARRKSLDSALSGMMEALLKDAIREQIKPLRKDVAALRRAVVKAAGLRRAGGGGGRRGGRRPIYTVCQVQDCNRRHQSRGFCQRHYNRLRNRGTLDAWADRIKAGEPVRENMIAAQRGVPLADRPDALAAAKRASVFRKAKGKAKRKGGRRRKK